MTKETLFEAVADINERYIEEARETCRTSRKWLWALAACLALVLICVPVVRYGIAWANEDIIIVNEGELWYYVSYAFENITNEAIEVAFDREFGISYEEFVDRLPDGYKVSDGVAKYRTGKDGERTFINCSLSVGLPNGKVAQVYLGEPLASPVVHRSDADRESRINGVPVMIYSRVLVLNNVTYDQYVAKFEHDGIPYEVRMTADCDGIDELTELLSALID